MVKARDTSLALPLGLFTLAVYLLLAPWTARVWLRTGDEPHYLIAAHSLAHDGDFDLANNYDPDVYQNWYTTAELGRQVRARADGAQFLVHTYGLPLLLAPVYRLFGYAGVPYFLAALGALLAANIYLLAHRATGDWRAAALGWFVVSFSPPLVWYVFLVYPEMPGALCVTVAARALLGARAGHAENRRARFSWPAFGLALAALPWLSARFIPAMLVLAALAAWRLWRARREDPAPAARAEPLLGLALAAAGLASFTIFNALLYQNPAPTASYAGTIAGPTASPYALLQLARGLMGWLMDQKQGLFISAPIYFLALVGLGQWLRRGAWGAVVAAGPFLAAWTSVSLLGGYWVGVEPAARYLVHALPPLGAALAYAWQHRRGPWLAILAAGAAVLGLATARIVFRQPLLAQTESLVAEKAPRLMPYLPALGRNIYLAPSAEGTSAAAAEDGMLVMPLGTGGTLFRQDAIPDFSFGWYDVRVQLGARDAPPDQPVARILVQGGDNTRLLQAILTGADFPADGSLRTFTYSIYNPVANQWEQPGGMWVFSTGQAELRLGQVSILPDPFYSLVLPALWLAGLAALGLLLGAQFNPSPASRPEPRGAGAPGLRAGLAALVVVAFLWSFQPLPRAYEAGELRHFTGALAEDPSAAQGEALIARLELADPPGVLASTRSQFYPPGPHVWRLRLRAGAAEPEAVLGATRILGARRPVDGGMLEIRARDVPADGQYHLVEVAFTNPVDQALVFELTYTAAATLALDRFTVTTR